MSFDVAVIGAGPAGMMAAYRAALRGLSVVVYDSNQKCGRKLRITGKGRCNITNNCDVKEFMSNIPGDGRFLYSAVNRFSMQDVMAFFEAEGLPLKTERGNRVFPVSDNANDVADLLTGLLKRQGVVIKRKTLKSLDEAEGEAVIIATGGCSYPLTGSTGWGINQAQKLGHNVIPPSPSLVPLESDDSYCRDLQGFSLKNVTLRAYEGDKLIFKELGEMLFTHFGVSGPLVLSASAHMRGFGEKQYHLEIDLKPALDEKALDSRILRDFSEYSNRQFINYLPKLTGKSMAEVVCSLSGIPGSTPCHDITREQRHGLERVLKAFPVSVSGTRPIDEAIVTAGGVDTREINPRTMQSLINPKYYFAGEILNLDAYTGGFNLQIAWSTGFVAGEEVLK